MARPARHPAVTPATLALVRENRQLRHVLRACSRLERRALLAAVLEGWRDTWARPQTCGRHKSAFARLFSVCARTVQHGKRLRQAMLQDKAEFCRQQFEAARGAGPAKFAHLLRAITRQGRKFKPPQVLPVICQDGCEHIGAAEVTRVLGASYASAERALPVTPEALVQQAHQVQPLHASLDRCHPSPFRGRPFSRFCRSEKRQGARSLTSPCGGFSGEPIGPVGSRIPSLKEARIPARWPVGE